jgi:hypothetical protein
MTSKPQTFRIEELMPALQMSATEIDRSTNYLVRNILEEWLVKKYGYQKDHFKKIRQQKKIA